MFRSLAASCDGCREKIDDDCRVRQRYPSEFNFAGRGRSISCDPVGDIEDDQKMTEAKSVSVAIHHILGHLQRGI